MRHQPTYEAVQQIRQLWEIADSGPEHPMKEFIVICLIADLFKEGRICEKHAHELVDHAIQIEPKLDD